MKLRYPEIKGATGIYNWGSPWGNIVSIEVGANSPELTDQEGALMKRDFPFLKDVKGDVSEKEKASKNADPKVLPGELPKDRPSLMKLASALGLKINLKMKNVELISLITEKEKEKTNG